MGLIGMFDRCVYGTALVHSSVDIGQQEFMNMVSIHILTKKGDHGYLSENFMGVDFGVIVLKG